MKKIVFVVVILLLATFCLTSCDQSTEYDKLNEMVSQSYQQVTIDVTVKKSGEADGLVHNIVCLSINDTTKHVAYTLQEYATFDVNGDTITAPDEQIVTKSGTAILDNGKVTTQTGDQVDYDFANVGKLNMNFNKACLSNSVVDGKNFTADVSNVALFLGNDIPGATNVKVSVDVQKYNSITLSYTANGSDITITYTLD